MTYAVKEIFYTLQGEGAQVGRPAVFCRFAGCNLWSGREQDRHKAICTFCDTDFRGGEKFKGAGALASAIRDLWPGTPKPGYVVLTGGEPLLQVNTALLDALHWAGFQVAVETNGTQRPLIGIDWLTVSPKPAPVVVTRADELKLVFPQERDPSEYDAIQATYRFLQPMDGPDREANTQAAIDYCLRDPRWRLSLQTHKIVGLQ